MDKNLTKQCTKCLLFKEDIFFDNCNDKKVSRCKNCRSEKTKNLNYQRQTEGTKKCSGCEIEKDVGQYYANKTSLDGLQSSCKQCQKKRCDECKPKNIDEFINFLITN